MIVTAKLISEILIYAYAPLVVCIVFLPLLFKRYAMLVFRTPVRGALYGVLAVTLWIILPVLLMAYFESHNISPGDPNAVLFTL